MPSSAVALLQGKKSVQMLDGPAHRLRKAMFLNLMSDERLEMGRTLFAEEWQAAALSWGGRTIPLRDEMHPVMTGVALRWCGIDPKQENVAARTEELIAMVCRAGNLGPGYLRAWFLRARSERWARGIIARARREGREGAVAALAAHRHADGRLLSDGVAAVELINLLRPIVAIGLYVIFAAHALHRYADLAATILADGRWEGRMAFADEVRRLYPFFPAIGGRVREPFTWRGHRFAHGEWLLLDLYGSNRDAEVWFTPESFAPFRHSASAPCDGLVPQGGGQYALNHRCPGEWLTSVLLTEAIGQLSALDYSVPAQSLEIPLNAFLTGPRDGMRLAVRPVG